MRDIEVVEKEVITCDFCGAHITEYNCECCICGKDICGECMIIVDDEEYCPDCGKTLENSSTMVEVIREKAEKVVNELEDIFDEVMYKMQEKLNFNINDIEEIFDDKFKELEDERDEIISGMESNVDEKEMELRIFKDEAIDRIEDIVGKIVSDITKEYKEKALKRCGK
jgi:ElaB/YqjD/DUF883 family membrane-anchored ribosome-binding protein